MFCYGVNMDRGVDEVKLKLKKYVCVTCAGLLKDPVQSICCGKRLCCSCVQETCAVCGIALEVSLVCVCDRG